MGIDALKTWVKDLLGPGGYETLVDLYYGTVGAVLAEPRLTLPLIASTLAVALLVYLFGPGGRRDGQGLLAFLVPRRVFLHPSARLDYKFYVVNQLVMGHLRLGRWVAELVGLLFIVQASRGALELVLGEAPAATAAPGFGAMLGYTVLTLLAWDFGKYAAHYVTHKLPVLWEFHKVHHSAEVLTPISAFRAHPVDIMIDLFFRLLCTGVVGGAYAYFHPGGITELTILGFNAVTFVIYYWIAHLQHSHIPLGYGALSRVLVSPVMHQVHHSRELQHWDRNFGFVFGFWDWMFRTIYVPRPGEPFRLGLPESSGEYKTLRAMYLTPFVGAYRKLFGRSAVAPSAPRS